MSDGIVRICNQHAFELRQIGGDPYVCPAGHSCTLEWHLKDDMPYADPIKRTCPIHQARLFGTGRILDCPNGHKCTTRRRPKERETPMPTTRVMQPHGTAKRYWQGCRCQPCKAAVNEHVKATKKAKKEGLRAHPAPTPRGEASRPKKAAPKARRRPGVDRGLKARAGELESRILRCRAELVEAKQALAAYVQELVAE